jgi:type II secretory pathway pseudopilin PulG
MTLVELMLAALLAGLLVTGAIRLAVASTDQQRAVLQGTSLQAELRRATGVVQQVVAEQAFLLPLRGNPAGLEFLQSIGDSRFQVLGVSPAGLTVRFLNEGYDPRPLRRAVVVDSGGNGYVYTLSRITVLDAASGTYTLEGTACAVPGGQGLRGVGAIRARLGSGAALNSFAGEGSLSANQLYFQVEDRSPEVLMSTAAPSLGYIFRAADGQTLHQESPTLFQQTGGQRFDLAGLALAIQYQAGAGAREARRELETDLLFQADAGLGLRHLDCNPLAEPPALAVGDWRIEITGLDPGVPGLVNATGPAGFARTLTASATLNGLQQGQYGLRAQSVVHPALPFVRYRPTSPAEGSSLGVAVGGANRPVTPVRYARLSGHLRVRVEGLPTGVSAPLHAAGSFAGHTWSLAAGEHLLPLEAGRYTLAWPQVADSQNRGTWQPDPASQGADVPSEGEATVSVRYALVAAPGRLEINVRLEGGGSPLAAPLICVQPSDTLSPIDPEATLERCAWR